MRTEQQKTIETNTDKKSTIFFLRHWPKIAICIVLLCTFIIYYQSFNYSFFYSWDDNWYITNNQDVQTLSWKNIQFYFSKFYVGNYQPLTMLMYAIEYKIGGGTSFIFHAINLIIHLINTVLVYLFIKKVSAKNEFAAVVTAAFFGIHPMHVESVAWISERKDVLYAFFFLLSLIAYCNFILTEKSKHLILSIIFFVLSCLSKSAAVVLPLILLLIDFYMNRKLGAKLIIEKIPLFIVALVFGIVAIYSQKSSIQAMAPSMSIVEHITMISYSFMTYLYKAFIPINLSAMYAYPSALGHALPFYYYLSIPALILVLVFVIYTRKLNKDILFGFGLFLIPLLLVLQIIPVGAAMMADRYTYIPYIGLFFIIGILVDRYVNKLNYKLISISMLVLVFFAFSFLSYGRIKIWENDDTLFTDVLEKYPNSYISYHDRGFYNVQSVMKDDYAGNEMNKAICIQKGIQDFESALKYAISADQKVSSYNNLGYAKFSLHDLQGSVDAFSNAIKLDSKCTSAYINRGFAYFNLKNFDHALQDFDQAIALNPTDSNAIKNRELVKAAQMAAIEKK